MPGEWQPGISKGIQPQGMQRNAAGLIHGWAAAALRGHCYRPATTKQQACPNQQPAAQQRAAHLQPRPHRLGIQVGHLHRLNLQSL